MPVSEEEGAVAGPVIAENACTPVVKVENQLEVPEVPCEENCAIPVAEEAHTAHNVCEELMPDVMCLLPVKDPSAGELEGGMDVAMDNGGSVEDKGQRDTFVEDTNALLIQCKEPFQELCDKAVASHVDVVTEVSWYTEEVGLTSVYTVHSLVIPPDGQQAQLTMANTLETFTPPLLLSPLPNPQDSLCSECPSEAHNAPGFEDPLPGIHVTNTTGAHCTELLVEQTSMLEVGEQPQELFSVPSTGNLGVHLLDVFAPLPAGGRISEDLKQPLGHIRLHEHLLLSGEQTEPFLNAPAKVLTQVNRTFPQDQLNVIPLYEGATDTLVLTSSSMFLTNNSEDQQEQLNVKPLAQGSAVTNGATPLGDVANAPQQNQLNVVYLQQAPAKAAHSTTPSGNQASALQPNQQNGIPLYQGPAEAAHSTKPSGNHASAPQQNQLKVLPIYLGPAEAAHSTTPSSNQASAPQQNQLNILPIYQGSAEEAHGTTPSGNHASVPQQNQLNVLPIYQGPAEAAHGTTPSDNQASALQPNQQNGIPLYWGPAEAAHGTSPLDNKAHTPELNRLQSTSVSCRGKRKHSWSSSPPPAKRQPYQYQPLSLPIWVFHQLSDSEHQQYSDLLKWEKKSVTNEGFSPKLIQYDASSELDWDAGLIAQQQCGQQQGTQLGELRTAQVNLNESWYGRELCSVLAHDQSLGSPIKQNVTLPHTSYDLYLRGVAS